MAILIIPKNPYDSDTALENVITYISDPAKTCGFVGAWNMLTEDCCKQTMAVNRYFDDRTSKNVIHFILSFSQDEYISFIDALYSAYDICKLLPEYQIAFGVHINTDNLHIHFAMNPISLIDGHKYYFSYPRLYSFLAGVRTIFESYGFPVSYEFTEYNGKN